ncbi:MAG: hypothetical protein KDB14_16200 [Planctomycetales bacterium]|nr:hypothetical protein [Planctomycetales bacterium]
MPATEQTWRDTKKLHFVFGVTSVILLLSTIWMFVKDFSREWKDHTATFLRIEETATKWREFQYAVNQVEARRQHLEARLDEIRRRGLQVELLADFKAWATGERKVSDSEAAPLPPVAGAPDFATFDALVEELSTASGEMAPKAKAESDLQLAFDKAKLALDDADAALLAADDAGREEAQKVRDAAADNLKSADGELETATNEVKPYRERISKARTQLVRFMQSVVDKATFNESVASKNRKFRMARLDAAVANLGIGVRDGLSDAEMEQLQGNVDRLKAESAELTKTWEDLKHQRDQLQRLLVAMTADESEILTQIDENDAGLRVLEKTREALRVNLFEGPLPGKGLLAMPILEAFNSPLKIDNLWSDGLEQTYGSFGNVRRFDRCTSCHRGMEKTLPGSATDPAYINEHRLELVLTTDVPEGVELEEESSAELSELEKNIAKVSRVYGLHFSNSGLVDKNDVTVAYLETRSLASQAALKKPVPQPRPGEEIQAEQLRLTPVEEEDLPGLRVGDVIESIDNAVIRDVNRVIYLLADAVDSGKPLTIQVRRGLAHPYSTHPRLDLFVGSLSPHKVTDFACTVCHDGQGSATDFKWASHMPDSPAQQAEWTKKYGWFDNHHWIFPMQPQRFIESVCLKCHHDVTELRPSEQFAEAPAPTVMHGYDLIRKYGCYGCHEVNGYDGPRSVGPDLRVEPNFFAGALQLSADPDFEKLDAAVQSQVKQLAKSPENTALRHEVLEALRQDGDAEQPALSAAARSAAIDALKDIESPGKLRKPGPSLRYLATKSDADFVFDWINKPANFRPTTRMPKFFGNWEHLQDDHASLALSELLEPVEAETAAYYLMKMSQSHDLLSPPEGISESDADAKRERGKVFFEERGCLACHSHPDFPEMAKFRAPGEIQQGPDLGGLGSKFDPARNPEGRKWLYSWIKEPTRYHARTVMPNLFLEPLQIKQGDETITVDPAGDIVEYLMSSLNDDWKPVARPDFGADSAALDRLVREHLNDAFIMSEVDSVLKSGVGESRRESLKVAERLLVVPDEDAKAGKPLSLEQKQLYVGAKTIAKFGCYGCHDIPGFEDAKPIGAGLADWGRKDASKLAFEHVHQYLHGSHGHGDAHGEHPLTFEESTKLAANPYSEGDDEGSADDHEGEHGEHADGHEYPDFYMSQLNASNRTGFIYQKLREPRSYDYHKTLNKKYNDRLRMPLFPFEDGEREAVITFVLGLVADPPGPKYIYKPSKREEALIAGGKVLEKFNCKGCHMLEPQLWELEFPEGSIGTQSAGATFPFTVPKFTPKQVAGSKELNDRNHVTAHLYGMPRLLDQGPPRILDEGDPIESDEDYRADRLDYTFELWKPALVDGETYRPGETPKSFEGRHIAQRRPAEGGDLARYLITPVGKRARQENSNAKVGEVWGWLPPPLHHEGSKVQTDWLHSFLLEPYEIRPATVLRMPKFNMSPDEATKLVNYFAAKENATYPYSYLSSRDPERLAELDEKYREEHGGESGKRLRDAMQIVTSGSYCVKCHHVADAESTASLRAQAPNLARVYERLRPQYLREWIAKPNGILPYTAMPVNVPYDAEKPFLGSTVPQDLYHGTSVEQVDALVDLLMNYDVYAQQESKVAPLVKAAADKAKEAGGNDAAAGAE